MGNSDTDILNVAVSYAAKGWRVFTIGLIGSGQVNESLLQQIATNTGGQYSRLSTPQQLVSVYFEILGKVTGGNRQSTRNRTPAYPCCKHPPSRYRSFR